MKDIRELLQTRPLLFDGAMGTYYKAAPGVECEQANLTDPAGVLAVHREYLAAGADAVKTNTFSLPRLAAAHAPGWEQLAQAGWQLAVQAAEETGAAVFADLGPAPDTEAVPAGQVYTAVAKQFAALGARNFLFETLSSDAGLLDAVGAIKAEVPDAFVLVSFAVLPDGYTREGMYCKDLARRMRLTKTNGPSDLTRFNLFNAISISGSPAQGYSSGQVLEAIGETAREVLPSNYTYEFGGISREESKTTNNATLIFLLCMVLVYLILCALYESVFIPFAVLLSVPCGLMGSFLFAWLFGLENNIYMQTGLIMIIGLLAKTAILLTEYAGKRRSEGMTLAQAAYSAAKVRLRPILMTVLSMVFGLVPLMMAHGVGANGSRSLATGVIGGMIVGTLALLFLVPSLFIVFQYIQERVKHN